MNLNNITLSDWLKDPPADCFPHNEKVDYYTHYKKLKDYLDTNIHNEVAIGANLKDPEMLLNDHGREHINTVISRASYLVNNSKCNLCPYEVYILLCCIELHDVGNILGRLNHEKNIDDIMLEAEGICGRDTIEAIIIKKIAETHGGRLEDGNKDKITTLLVSKETIYGTIRPRLIAAILRFSDELADDKTRAFRTLLVKNQIPKKSEVFHAYASTLEVVKVNHSEASIDLSYHIPRDFLLREFGKLDSVVLLLDEIYDRLLKMHFERKYCMRFCKGNIDIEKLRVTIEFYDKTLDYIFPAISFEVKEDGYPGAEKNLFEMCPNLTENGTRMDGEYFKKKLENEKSV